jgi:hypothetical protein
VELDVRRGESYTLLVATYEKALGSCRELDFTVSLTNAATGAPLALQCTVAPVGAETLAGREGKLSAETERARRAAALASMRAAACNDFAAVSGGTAGAEAVAALSDKL